MGEGSYITFFSPSDVTALHIMKYGGGGGGYITLFSPSDVTAFHRIATRSSLDYHHHNHPRLQGSSGYRMPGPE